MNIFDQFSTPSERSKGYDVTKPVDGGNIFTNLDLISQLSGSDTIVQFVDEDGNPIEDVDLSMLMVVEEDSEMAETVVTDTTYHLNDHTYCLPADKIRNLLPDEGNQEKNIKSQLGSLVNLLGEKITQSSPLPAGVKQSDSVTEQKRLQCEICNYMTSCQQALEKHKSTHIMGKFMCHLCGKMFGSESFLAQHVSLHTGEKKFTCEICGQLFLDDGSLTIHLAKHTESPLVVCHLCDKVIPSNEALQKHLTEVHTRQTSFTCSVCSVQFKYKIACIKHMSRRHRIRMDEKDVTINGVEQTEDLGFGDSSSDSVKPMTESEIRNMERNRKLIVSIERIDLQTMRGIYMDPGTVLAVTISDSTQAEPVKRKRGRPRKSLQKAEDGSPFHVTKDFCAAARTTRRRSDSLSVSSLDSAIDLGENNQTKYSQCRKRKLDDEASRKDSESNSHKSAAESSNSDRVNEKVPRLEDVNCKHSDTKTDTGFVSETSKSSNQSYKFVQLLQSSTVAQKVIQNYEQIFCSPHKQEKTAENQKNTDKNIPVTANVDTTPQVSVHGKNIFDDFDITCQNLNCAKLPDDLKLTSQVKKDKPNSEVQNGKTDPLVSNLSTADENVNLSPSKRFRNIFDDFLTGTNQSQEELKSPQIVSKDNSRDEVHSREVKSQKIEIAVKIKEENQSNLQKSSPLVAKKPETSKTSPVNKAITNLSSSVKKTDSSSQKSQQNTENTPTISSVKTEDEDSLKQRPKRMRMKKADSDFVYYGESNSSIVGRLFPDTSVETPANNKPEKSLGDSKSKHAKPESVSEDEPENKTPNRQSKPLSSSEANVKKKVEVESKQRHGDKVEQKTLRDGNSPVDVGSRRRLSHSRSTKESSSLPPAVKSGLVVNGIENKAVQIVVNEKGKYVSVTSVVAAKTDKVGAKNKVKNEPKENIDVDSKQLRRKSLMTPPAGVKNGKLTPKNGNSKKGTPDLPKGRGRPKSKIQQEMKTPKSVPKGRGRPKKLKPTSKTRSKYSESDEDFEDDLSDEENDSGVSKSRSDGEDESSEEEEEVEAEVVYFSHDPLTGDIILTSNPNNKKTSPGNTLVNIDLNKGEMKKGDIFINPDAPDMEYVLVDCNCLLPITMLEPIESSVIRIDSEAEWNGQIL